MAGGSGFACAAALVPGCGAGGVAGWPAAGGAGEVADAVAAPAGFEGEGGTCVVPGAGSLTGLLCGPEVQAAASTRKITLDGKGDAIASANLQSRIEELAASASVTIGSTEAIPAENRDLYRRLGLRLVSYLLRASEERRYQKERRRGDTGKATENLHEGC